MISDKICYVYITIPTMYNLHLSPLKTQTGSGYFLVPDRCMMASKRKREDDFEYTPLSAKMNKNEDSEY